MEELTIQVRQLANRLESHSTTEKSEALSELLSLSRKNSELVGKYSIPHLFNILKENITFDEYLECLDLISSLISKNSSEPDPSSPSSINALLILDDPNNLDLLLELLEHSDLTIGILVSEILSFIHFHHPKVFEKQIQNCPDGN